MTVLSLFLSCSNKSQLSDPGSWTFSVIVTDRILQLHLILREMGDTTERAERHPEPPTVHRTDQQALILFKDLVHHIGELLAAPSVISSSEPLLPTKPYYPGKR